MYAFPSVKLPPKAIEEREMLKTLAETVIFGALLTVKIMLKASYVAWSVLGVTLGKTSLAFLGEIICPQDAKEKDQEPDGALVAVEEPQRCFMVPLIFIGMLRSL